IEAAVWGDGSQRAGIEIPDRRDAAQGVPASDDPLLGDVRGLRSLFLLVPGIVAMLPEHAFRCDAHRRPVLHEEGVLVIQLLQDAFEQLPPPTPPEFTYRRLAFSPAP